MNEVTKKQQKILRSQYFSISKLMTVFALCGSKLSTCADKKNSNFNLQEFQGFNFSYLLGYTPTYVVPHKIPSMSKENANYLYIPF